jgi:hypothetical protein
MVLLRTAAAFLLAWSMAASAAAPAGDFDYDAYLPAAVLADVESDLPDDPTAWFSAGHPRFQTEVVFSGQFRPLTAEKKQFVREWVTKLGYPAESADVFEQEVEVSQAEAHYWMPIQAQLVDKLRAEVDTGSEFRAYVALMGIQQDRAVFAINEFDAEGDEHAPAAPR